MFVKKKKKSKIKVLIFFFFLRSIVKVYALFQKIDIPILPSIHIIVLFVYGNNSCDFPVDFSDYIHRVKGGKGSSLFIGQGLKRQLRESVCKWEWWSAALSTIKGHVQINLRESYHQQQQRWLDKLNRT